MDLIENLDLKNENNFFENTFGNIINNAIEMGMRSLLPDSIENDAIDIKNTLITQGIPEAINETINKVINYGKNALNILGNNFENINEIGDVFEKGNLLEGVSNVIDYFLEKTEKNNILPKNIIGLIKEGKNIIMNGVNNNVKNELTTQEKNINKLNNYNQKWREAYEKHDFESMEKIINKIEKLIKNIVPIEKIINESREIENLHSIIKNNGINFNISNEEKELSKLLI